MEGGFNAIFVACILGLLAMDRKDFSHLSDIHYGLWGLFFPCFFWSTRCCNKGKEGLKSYWHLRNSQRSDWYVSFRTKLISRFWSKNLCKVKFTQTFWILPLPLTVGQNTLHEITVHFHLTDFYVVVASVKILTNKAMTAAYLHLNCWNYFCVDHSMCYWIMLQLKYSVYGRQLSVLPETQFPLYYSNLNEQNIKYSKSFFVLETVGSWVFSVSYLIHFFHT